MLSCPISDVAALLPHSGHMVLLDEVLAYDHESLQASAHIGADHVLMQPDGTVPAWMAMEIMAQCIAALDGIHAHNGGESVRLGFLLGTRKLHLFADTLPLGCELLAETRQSIRDNNGFAVFDCSLRIIAAPAGFRLPENGLVAQAALNVFSPPDLDGYLAQTQKATT
ncbi:ApeP family dehydratase [Paralysiella testudinis]|uniref:Thioester dehydrase n=1 Tax=Paralysiella testudinis TaxID=2809020 RepID=A0A892ZH67_9NEIS|nr:thioester dehydrase [Paralysiella testudinis]QRQ81983.1 thioester dehydrase [Paralysiella testudinis]